MPPSAPPRYWVAVTSWGALGIVVEAPDHTAAEQLIKQLWAEDPNQFRYRENGTNTSIANSLDCVDASPNGLTRWLLGVSYPVRSSAVIHQKFDGAIKVRH